MGGAGTTGLGGHGAGGLVVYCGVRSHSKAEWLSTVIILFARDSAVRAGISGLCLLLVWAWSLLCVKLVGRSGV